MHKNDIIGIQIYDTIFLWVGFSLFCPWWSLSVIYSMIRVTSSTLSDIREPPTVDYNNNLDCCWNPFLKNVYLREFIKTVVRKSSQHELVFFPWFRVFVMPQTNTTMVIFASIHLLWEKKYLGIFPPISSNLSSPMWVYIYTTPLFFQSVNVETTVGIPLPPHLPRLLGL